MEFEALLLGMEPLTAVAIGVGSLVITPLVKAVQTFNDEHADLRESLAESARVTAKNGLILALDTVEKTQTFWAETGESFQDLLAEAARERKVRAHAPVQEVKIEV